MPEKNPETWSMFTWLLTLGFATLGGFAGWFKRMKAGEREPFKVKELLGELVIAWLLGTATVMAAIAWGMEPGYAYGLGGICAHFGTKALDLVEKLFEAYMKKLTRNVEEQSGANGGPT